jgi:hypothetical protein
MADQKTRLSRAKASGIIIVLMIFLIGGGLLFLMQYFQPAVLKVTTRTDTVTSQGWFEACGLACKGLWEWLLALKVVLVLVFGAIVLGVILKR